METRPRTRRKGRPLDRTAVGRPLYVPVGDGVESLRAGLDAGPGHGAESVEHVGLGDDEDCPMHLDRCVHGVPEVRRHSWTGVKDRGASENLFYVLIVSSKVLLT